MYSTEALLCERDRLQRFALRLTRNPSDADDLLQSTLLQALEKKDYFQEGTNLFSWASKIMFNIFAGQYRRKKKFETRFDPQDTIDQASVTPSQEMAVDLAKVKSSMGSLPREQREVMVLVCMRGMRYEEVSQALKIPVGTVRSRLFRARSQLQNLMEPVAPANIAAIYAANTAAMRASA